MARTEIELNKEVLDYKESIFFGLSLRQFICSLLAVIVAVTVFLKFNTLTLEKFLWQKEEQISKNDKHLTMNKNI